MKYALPLLLALAFVACVSFDDDSIAGPGNALAPFLDLSAVVIEADCHDETARYRLDAVVVWPEGKPAGVNVLSRTFAHTDGWSEKIYGQGSATHEVGTFEPGAWTAKGMLSNGTPILPDSIPAEPRQDAECSSSSSLSTPRVARHADAAACGPAFLNASQGAADAAREQRGPI